MNDKDCLSVSRNSINDNLTEEVSLGGERRDLENAKKLLAKIELGLAYSSEKVLNLEILLMQIANRFSDIEAMMIETIVASSDWMGKSFELDMLLGLLDSEVNELSLSIGLLQQEILQARKDTPLMKRSGMNVEEIEDKLHDADESLIQSWGRISDIKVQVTDFERILSTRREENCNAGTDFTGSALGINHTLELRRHDLQMLEKSLARELDLEKRLSDARHNEEEIKLKLHRVEHALFCLEEETERILEKLFQAENISIVFTGISKGFPGKLQQSQFNLKESLHHEKEIKYSLEENGMELPSTYSTLNKLKSSREDYENSRYLSNEFKNSPKEAEDNSIVADTEAWKLAELVTVLERELVVSNVQLDRAQSLITEHEKQYYICKEELTNRNNEIFLLKEAIQKEENRLKTAEANRASLEKSNLELSEDLFLLKAREEWKFTLLKGKLEESNNQLEHGKESIKAIQQEQIMLCSALSSTESLIEDLRMNASQAEKRAEVAESNCTLLTRANLQLKEELCFLRLKVESLEATCQQTNAAKAIAVKEIGSRTEVITNLVMKLASERERLQMQLHALKTDKIILTGKVRKTNESGQHIVIHTGDKNGSSIIQKVSEGVASESSVTNLKRHAFIGSTSVQMQGTSSGLVADIDIMKSRFQLDKTAEGGRFSSRQIAMAFLVLLMSGLVLYLLRVESCPF